MKTRFACRVLALVGLLTMGCGGPADDAAEPPTSAASKEEVGQVTQGFARYGQTRYAILFDYDGATPPATSLDVSSDGVTDIYINFFVSPPRSPTVVSLASPWQVATIPNVYANTTGNQNGGPVLVKLESTSYVRLSTMLRTPTNMQSLEGSTPFTTLQFPIMDVGVKAYLLVGNPNGFGVDADMYCAGDPSVRRLSLPIYGVIKVPLTNTGLCRLQTVSQYTELIAQLAVRRVEKGAWIQTPISPSP
jgi:hypothetical protein